MWKLKNQTLISAFGLAVGLTCFALATLWLVHEMTYDNFHKNAKNKHVILTQDIHFPTTTSRMISYPATSNLTETFPEITKATSLIPSPLSGRVRINGVESLASTLTIDSSFEMFTISHRQQRPNRVIIP